MTAPQTIDFQIFMYQTPELFPQSKLLLGFRHLQLLARLG